MKYSLLPSAPSSALCKRKKAKKRGNDVFIYFWMWDFFPEYKCAVQGIYSLDFVPLALSECRRGRRKQPARRKSMSGFIPHLVLRPAN
jgi:hypothetical protein